MRKAIYILIKHIWMFSIMFAQWTNNPENPLLLGSGIQPQVKMASNGDVYYAWLTEGNYHVYLQKLNEDGIIQFSDGGMLISDNNNSSWIAVYHLNLAVDSENNAIITLVDQRYGSWEVYAYKINPNGEMIWGIDGLSLSNSGVSNISPRLVVLPDNSIVVSWSKNYNSVVMQRISPNGELLWNEGIAINNLLASLMSPQPIINSNGELLLQWISQTGQAWAADSKLYLQKYNLDGSFIWNEPTVTVGPVVFPMGNWSQQLVKDGINGSFAAWTEMSGNAQDAVVQHIDEDGQLSWIGGLELSQNSSNFQVNPKIAVSENSQELMAVWNESNASQSQRGVYAQRIDQDGNKIWGINGSPVVPLNNNFDYLNLSIVEVGEGFIASYIQQSSNMNSDIYAVRIDGNCTSIWLDNNAVITNSNNPKSDMTVEKGVSCIFISWSENGNIYTHCLNENGTLGPIDSSHLGDVNSDGNIDVLDVVMLVNQILGSNTLELDNADINDDNEINILDVVALISIILS